MNNPTKLIILFGAICLLALLPLKYCNTPTKEPNYKQALDSIKQQLAIERKQMAFKQAQWEKESVLSNQRDRDQQAQISALVERSQRQTIQYKQVIEKILQEAPKPCEPYIAQIADECNKVIEAKDDVIAETKARNDSLYNDKMEALGFIKVQADYIKKDSIADAGKDAIMEGLLKDNKKLERKTKRNKIAAWFIGGGLFGLWLLTSFKG